MRQREDVSLYRLPDIDSIVAAALAEDLGVSAASLLPSAPADEELLLRDVTTSSVVGEDAHFTGTIVAREDCVVCGLPVADVVFKRLAAASGLFDSVDVFPIVAEGQRVSAGTAVAEIDGLTRAVLAAERTALDFLMVLSGIATETARWVEAAAGRVEVCDTRKTLPGLRALSKYAVSVGGGTNHRQGLGDMVLIKDNHLRHVAVREAIERARAAHPELLVQAEADTVAQAVEAVTAGADLVLLDNMDVATLGEAVWACRAAEKSRRVLLEVSGGVTADRLPEIALSGVDRVSSSAITLALPIDFGLDEAQ